MSHTVTSSLITNNILQKHGEHNSGTPNQLTFACFHHNFLAFPFTFTIFIERGWNIVLFVWRIGAIKHIVSADVYYHCSYFAYKVLDNIVWSSVDNIIITPIFLNPAHKSH